jgi:transposase
MDTKQKISVSTKLVKQAATERWMKPLALFHLMKVTFGNSVIFGYRRRMKELSERFGVSRKTFYNYLDILRYQELIVNFPGNPQNLHLKSIKSIKQSLDDKRKCNITISQSDGIWEISCRLYGKLIESHLRKMAFVKAIQGYGRRKLHKVGAGNEGAPDPVFSLSIRNVAKILNIGRNTATQVLKTLKNLKVIKLYEQKPVKISAGKLDVSVIEDYPGYKFTTDNGTFLQFGSKIESLEYLVKIPKISPKIYSKYSNSIQCKNDDNY